MLFLLNEYILNNSFFFLYHILNKLLSALLHRCKLQGIIAEVDRILRPKGTLIVRDDVETITEIENMAKSLQWKVQLTYSKDKEGLLCVQKSMWRPTEVETISSAIA